MLERQGDSPEPPDYDAIEARMWQKNVGRVLKELEADNPHMHKKINTFAVRFGYDKDDVVGEILSNEMSAAMFSKKPDRQGMHEEAAGKWLEQLDNVNNFLKLPKRGNSACYITGDGEVRNVKRKPPGSSKSLDFCWETGVYTIFAAHKFTREGGGSQDNQFLEVRNLLELFQKGSASEQTVLLIIVDGPYFTETKMNDLHRFEREKPPFSKALSIGDVPAFLEGLP